MSENETSLSRRERQIMDIIFTLGRASGPEIQERLPDQPSYSGVRTILRVLERKGHIRHVEEGMRYVYLPVVAREKAKQSAIARLVSHVFRRFGQGCGSRVPRSRYGESLERRSQRTGTRNPQGA